MSAQRPIRVGIVGLGRSGWDIHARTLGAMPEQYRVSAATDGDPRRRLEARDALGCRPHESFAAVLADDEVELVVIATPSHVHFEQTIASLNAGKHVVCEKPMALSSADADRMIDASVRARRVLTVFHNMRYWPDFRTVGEVIGSGVLGRIVQIKITMHRFARRWDWQTLRAFGGGALFNAGAHLVDLALQFFGDGDPEVFADLQHTLSSGDAEDHAKILLRGGASPTIEVEISNACAYPQDTWHVMGTAGGLRGSSEQLWWKWVDVAALPDRPVDRNPSAEDRRFNSEQMTWQQGSWSRGTEQSPDYRAFYRDLHGSLRHGTPLVVTPDSVRRTVAVLERCRAAATAGTSQLSA